MKKQKILKRQTIKKIKKNLKILKNNLQNINKKYMKKKLHINRTFKISKNNLMNNNKN